MLCENLWMPYLMHWVCRTSTYLAASSLQVILIGAPTILHASPTCTMADQWQGNIWWNLHQQYVDTCYQSCTLLLLLYIWLIIDLNSLINSKSDDHWNLIWIEGLLVHRFLIWHGFKEVFLNRVSSYSGFHTALEHCKTGVWQRSSQPCRNKKIDRHINQISSSFISHDFCSVFSS